MTFEELIEAIEPAGDIIINTLASLIQIMGHPTLAFLGTYPYVIFLLCLVLYPICRVFKMSPRHSAYATITLLVAAMLIIIPLVTHIMSN